MSGAMKWTLLALLLLPSLSLAEECVPGKTKIQITNIVFENTSGLTTSLKNEIREQIEAKVHDYCQLADEMPQRARDILQRHGYFKALVYDPTWKQVGGSDSEQQVQVLLVMELGSVFKLDSIRFSGSMVFDQQQLRSAIPMADGDLFNVEFMRDGLKNLRELYCSVGYINFTPVPNTEIDEERHVIRVLFDLDQGEQYHVGQLYLNGQEPYPGAGETLLEAWKPYIGKVWDCRLSERILTEYNKRHGHEPLAVCEGSSPVHVNHETKTIDVTFEFPDRK